MHPHFFFTVHAAKCVCRRRFRYSGVYFAPAAFFLPLLPSLSAYLS